MPERRFGGFTDFVSEVNRMRALGRTGQDPGHQQDERVFATAWVPVADMFARGGDLVIRLELPGLAAGDLHITCTNGTLTVAGERQTAPDAAAGAFYVRERYHGAFRRSMTLPEGTTAAALTAAFEAGVLEIVVAGGAAGREERVTVEDRSAAGAPVPVRE